MLSGIVGYVDIELVCDPRFSAGVFYGYRHPYVRNDRGESGEGAGFSGTGDPADLLCEIHLVHVAGDPDFYGAVGGDGGGDAGFRAALRRFGDHGNESVRRLHPADRFADFADHGGADGTLFVSAD